MQAVVFHAPGDFRLEEVADPKIQDPTDAVIRITASAICGTDLHFVQEQPLADVVDAYEHFDQREAGGTKVELTPARTTETIRRNRA